ncbi:hypothetical protein AJ79_04079 [Helicocarpus griseus UAMH5409]|uniref:Uncharacterized protein n=1 Tax=Helicocarpus griseus UAMH5409 TaxID=1447875 RepID=A0A2B7XUS1_9EURO|nr:hypothetical protein AJ79_04079 [Helicocarpus griseus UAMH5409]
MRPKREIALMEAVRVHDAPMIKFLLERGAVDNAHELFSLAALNDCPEVLEVLLDVAGFDIELPLAGWGATMLQRTAWYCRTNSVRFLLNIGANIHARTSSHGRTALHMIGEHLHSPVPTIMLLIERGVDIGARDNLGQTALHTAASHNRSSVVRALLDIEDIRTFFLEATDMDGCTALHMAARSVNTNIIEMLLAAGANAEAGDKNQNTPLDLANRARLRLRRGTTAVEMLTKYCETKK